VREAPTSKKATLQRLRHTAGEATEPAEGCLHAVELRSGQQKRMEFECALERSSVGESLMATQKW